MAKFYDWVKLALDNRWLIVMLFGFVSSSGYGVYQKTLIDDQEKTIEGKNKQIVGIAEQVQSYISRETPKSITYKPSITEQQVRAIIKAALDQHVRTYHQ